MCKNDENDNNGLLKYLKFKYVVSLTRKLAPRYQKLIVFERSLNDPVHPSKIKLNIDFSIKQSIIEINSLIEQREQWYQKLAEKRFKQGNLCFVGECQDKIISCVWTSFGEVYLPNVKYTLKVPQDVVPLIDGWTSPEFRGKGIYNYVWNKCLEHLSDKSNYKRIYGFIQPTNESSLVIHKKMNLDKVIIIIKLFNFFGFKHHKVVPVN